jgi:hypothetical protein
MPWPTARRAPRSSPKCNRCLKLPDAVGTAFPRHAADVGCRERYDRVRTRSSATLRHRQKSLVESWSHRDRGDVEAAPVVASAVGGILATSVRDGLGTRPARPGIRAVRDHLSVSALEQWVGLSAGPRVATGGTRQRRWE